MGDIKELHIRLDKKTFYALQSLADQKGQSVSSVIREAIAEFLSFSETKNTINELKTVLRKLTEQVIIFENSLPELTAFMRMLNQNLRDLRVELEEMRKAVEVSTFFSALVAEILKVRIFQTKALGLSQQEYNIFKNTWQLSHERADLRVQALLGKRVWKRKFNPVKPPEAD